VFTENVPDKHYTTNVHLCYKATVHLCYKTTVHLLYMTAVDLCYTANAHLRYTPNIHLCHMLYYRATAYLALLVPCGHTAAHNGNFTS